jgi:hypothetical protein
MCMKHLEKINTYYFTLLPVTWAPVKSGELLSSLKSDYFAIRFYVA